MLAAINITIRTDEEVKKQSEQVLHELGLNMSTAVNAFLRTVARQKKIPFELTLTEADPLLRAENAEYLAMLNASIKEAERGELVKYTMDELKALVKGD